MNWGTVETHSGDLNEEKLKIKSDDKTQNKKIKQPI